MILERKETDEASFTVDPANWPRHREGEPRQSHQILSQEIQLRVRKTKETGVLRQST